MASDENREPATPWRILDSHNAFEHRWYVLRRDTVELPDGGVIDDYFVSVRPEVVVVGSFIMVRQYQHGAASWKKRPVTSPAGSNLWGLVSRMPARTPTATICSWPRIATRGARKNLSGRNRPLASPSRF